VDRIRIGYFGGRHEAGDIQVGIRTGGFSNAHGFVREAHVQAILISCGINGYGLDPHFPACPDHPQRDLSPVCNQYFLKHSVEIVLARKRYNL
jgi:hypothetical protein